jgi:CMP-N-acetylneuraminic acid synthetase
MKVIIPARGGSKGVPRKNIRLLNGIPLIAYPILQAKQCERVSKIYVSTDDGEIADIAREYEAEVIERPAEYATDISLDIDVMRHAVGLLGSFDDLVHLRATTPLVKASVIDRAIEYFLENPHCTSLRSAHETPETAYKYFQKNDLYWSGLFNDKMEGEYYNLPRQSLPKTYHPNGYVDILKPSWFMHNNSIHGERILAFETPYSHEVDTVDDFKILEALCG